MLACLIFVFWRSAAFFLLPPLDLHLILDYIRSSSSSFRLPRIRWRPARCVVARVSFCPNNEWKSVVRSPYKRRHPTLIVRNMWMIGHRARQIWLISGGRFVFSFHLSMSCACDERTMPFVRDQLSLVKKKNQQQQQQTKKEKNEGSN